MRQAGKMLGMLLGGALGAGAIAGPQQYSMPVPQSAPMMTAAPPQLTLADVIQPEFRDAAMKVIRNSTISTKAMGEEVLCTVSVYEWLYDHPDRVALAWRRLRVPAITITDLGGGRFAWADENGSEVVWRTVGKYTDGRVWYATGRIKGGKLAPAIPVQGVIVVSHPRKVEKDGVAVFAPTAQAYMHSDSRAANLALRALGPAAPRLAEEAAEQLLDFFGGIANYVQKHPKKADSLLGPAE